MKSFEYTNLYDNVDNALEFIKESALSCGIGKKNMGANLYYVKKMLEYIAHNYPDNEKITVEVNSMLGDIRLRFYYKGDKINVEELIAYSMTGRQAIEIDDVTALKLRKIYSNYFESSKISHKYTGENMNITTILLKKSSYKNLIVLMTSLLSGVLAGLLIRFIFSDSAGAEILETVFSSISKVFVNCVKMIVGPLMFFSIGSSISSYSDLSSLGRLGGKLVVRYLINALIAFAVSVGVILLLKPGVESSIPSIESFIKGSSSVAETVSNNSVSLRDTLMNFFPSNFFKAFVEASMMQIIFISFLVGISTGLLNTEAKTGIFQFLSYGNQLFCKMVNVIMIFLPVSVFCSMASSVVMMGVSTLLLLVKWVIALIAAFFIMAVIYILMIMLFAHINPFTFVKKYSEAILGTFAFGSCNSSLPTCIGMIGNKMGVSNRIAALTIPIGVSIHCASNCIFYLISVFFLANIYTGIEISPLSYPMIFLSILVLGIGAPSISGSGPICVAMLLPQVGVPMGLITLIMGLDPFISMFKSACSCIEDASVTLEIARSENGIDEKVIAS